MPDKELARCKKMELMKQRKKNKHAKVKGNHAMGDGVVELLSHNKDNAKPKLKKKTKRKALESSSPLKDNESSFVDDDAETPNLKKKKRKVKEQKSTTGLNDAEEICHVNQDEESQRGMIASQLPRLSAEHF
jgi:ribosomal RNA-processing protein 7